MAASSPLPSEALFRLRDTRQAMAGAIRYTRIVGHLRWVLPAAAIALLGALVLWPILGADTIKQMAENAVPNLVIENLRLSGMDTKNNPYRLMAERALQVPEIKGVIDLEKPQGEITGKDGAWIAGQALRGRYDQTNKKLWLGGDVELFHDNGMQFETSEAQVDLSKNQAWGNKPIVIHGNFGEIHGQGFKMMDGGKSFIVTGKSKAVLRLKNKDAETEATP